MQAMAEGVGGVVGEADVAGVGLRGRLNTMS